MAKRHTPRLALNGRYRVEIGGRNFWLGKDQELATKLTNNLDIAFDNETTLNAQGKKTWSDKQIAWAFNGCGVKSPVEPAEPPQPKASKPGTNLQSAFQPRTITFHEALDQFVVYRQTIRTIGEHTIEDSEKAVKSLKRVLRDRPLVGIDSTALEDIRNTILDRPPRAVDGEPISIPTVKKWFMELGMAFNRFSHPDSGIGWVPLYKNGAPYPQWREKFALDDARNIATPDDKLDEVKPTYNLEQLVTIYSHPFTTSQDKLYLLAAICLGWSAKELATLKRSSIQVDAQGEMFISKRRSKTGVPCTFWICPEMANLLKRAVANTESNPDDLALMTRNRRLGGKPFPLIHGLVPIQAEGLVGSHQRLPRRSRPCLAQDHRRKVQRQK